MVGWDFELPDGRGKPLSSRAYLSMLRKHAASYLEWDAAGAEHILNFKEGGKEHAIYHTSLRGLAERLGAPR